MEDGMSVECSNCGFIFQNEEPNKPRENWKPCPQCGSRKRMVRLAHQEALDLHEYVELEAKKPSSKHKKHRADYEFGEGEKVGKDGKLVYKKHVFDRERITSTRSYVETVKDKDGNIIVNKHEKLSEHREE